MKRILFILVLMSGTLLYGQNQKDANVYPSNLDENMYYDKYDATSGIISGIHFLVLCDGNNSQDYTPAFEVSLYLIPKGSTNESDVVIVKTYKLKGIYHMGSHEFKNESVPLGDVEGLVAGNYRLGIWVNSNKAFEENGQDNAILFKEEIIYNPAVLKKKPATEAKSEENDSAEEATDKKEDTTEEE